MAYKVIILYQLYMPSYFLGTFTEYPSVSDKPPDHSEFMPEPGEKFLCQRAPIKVTFILIGSVPGVKGADTSISKLAFLSFTVPLTVISA